MDCPSKTEWKGPLPTSVVCSAHFVEEDFEPESLFCKSFGLKKSKKLKPGAIPSIFKRTRTPSHASPTVSTAAESPPHNKKRRTAYEKRERRRVIYDLCLDMYSH